MSIDQYSLAALPLTLLHDETPLGHGTAFLWDHDGALFMITNRHLVTGLTWSDASQKLELLWNHGGHPNRVCITFHNGATATWSILQNEKPQWYEHPLGIRVDVVAVPLPADGAEKLGALVQPVNRLPAHSRMRLAIGGDVFVLGFPLGMQPTGALPVWKRASIATEHDVDVGGLPMFLIDTATRPGMSGSPVILRALSYMDEGNNLIIDIGPFTRFLGVYSGRTSVRGEFIGTAEDARTQQLVDELRGQLGIVWKARVIDEILNARKVPEATP